jgi:zinc protease
MRPLERLIAPIVLSGSLIASLAGCPGSSSTPTPDPQEPGASNPSNPDGPTKAPEAPAATIEEVRAVEGITEYRMSNGLQVLLFPDESQAKVTVNITYYVGSRHEGYGEAGMAHLLEHMLFKGTPDHPNVMKLLEDRGAGFNGTTWTDRTNYFETLQASDENLDWALGLEADRMINASIDPEELAKEFSVVRNEFEIGENSPTRVLSERLYSTAYLWHNYGKSTIGNRSDIERVPVKALRRFYEKYYQPDNATLVIAGRFDKARALEKVREHFGRIPKPARELDETYTVEPIQDGEREVTLRRVGDVQLYGLLYHGVPGSHADHVALQAYGNLMTNTPSGRLYQALVKKGMATRVWDSAYSWRDPGAVTFMAEIPEGKSVDKVAKIMIDALESPGPIKKEEVERYKAKAIKAWELAFTRSDAIAVELSEVAAMGDWRLLFLERDRIEKLTVADVERAAKTYFKRSNRTAGRFIPTKEPDRTPLIAGIDVGALVKGYKGRKGIAEGEKFDASIANITARTTRTKLAKGLELAMLPKKTRGAAVRAQLVIHFASEKDLAGKSAMIGLIPAMIQRGTRSKSYQELRDELDRLKARVSFGGGGLFSLGNNSVTATVETTRANLPATIALVAEMLREPSFPADQFKILKEQSLTQLKESKNTPQAVGFLAMIRALNPWPKGDARYIPSLDEQIAELDKVKLGDLKRFHASFWGADNAQMAVVGDFDAARVKAVIEDKLGSWKAKRPYKRVATPYKAKKPTTLAIDTPDKQMAVIAAAHTFKLRDDHPDYPAVELAGYILGGGTSSRMMSRLRQKEGLSYAAFGAVQVSSEDPFGLVFTGAMCAPDNAAKAMKAMDEEIAKLIDKGVDAKELAVSKEAFLKKFDQSLTNDGFLVAQLTGDMRLGRDLGFTKKVNDKIKALTVAEINATIKKYFSTTRLVHVTAGDLAKAGMKK